MSQFGLRIMSFNPSKFDLEVHALFFETKNTSSFFFFFLAHLKKGWNPSLSLHDFLKAKKNNICMKIAADLADHITAAVLNAASLLCFIHLQRLCNSKNRHFPAQKIRGGKCASIIWRKSASEAEGVPWGVDAYVRHVSRDVKGRAQSDVQL